MNTSERTSRLTHLVDEARRRFGRAGAAVRAPGRVNLIGDHTDYQDGFVLPMAIELDTWCIAHRREDRLLHLHSLEMDETVTLSLDELLPGSGSGWSRYPAGVAWALEQSGRRLTGIDALFQSIVPIGSGLSSSAALEMATLFAFGRTNGFTLLPVEAAGICRRAENEYAGVATGIMDQYVAASGEEGRALLIDCRALTHRSVPIPPDARFLIADSGVSHRNETSGYGRRRAETEAAVRAIQRRYPHVRALRDATLEMIDAVQMEDVERRRARHVISENARTALAADALDRGDLAIFGRLMLASHASLRDDFAVSTPELDTLVEAAMAGGALGARLTGGGFGGATVCLVAGDVETVRSSIVDAFATAYGRSPAIFVSSAGEGAGDVVVTTGGDAFQRNERRLGDGRYFIDYEFPS